MKYKITICTEKNKVRLPFPEGISLHTFLSSNGYVLSSPCGGNGTCGKCKVLAEGFFTPPVGTLSSPTEILACKAYPAGDCIVHIKENSALTPDVQSFPLKGERLGIAFDIGTTSVSAILCSLDRKCRLSSLTCKNAQSAFGADIISRMSHPAPLLSSLLINQINSIIRVLSPDLSAISKLAFAANTVMSHYIAGLSPDGLSKFPLTPADTFGKSVPAKNLGLLAENAVAYIFPSLAPFVGGDISSGLFSLDLPDGETSLLLDLGTNGEMALSKSGQVFVASAAAGPAFEGGELSCGTSAVPGAVIAYDGKKFKTVKNISPLGIAGSGAIDLLAELLESGIVDKGGRLLPPDEVSDSRLSFRDTEAVFEVSDNIYLSASDIRALQLAKAAIRACFSLLLKATDTNINEIKKVYIAGDFGANVNIANASKIGLIPAELIPFCTATGNSSLEGSCKFLFDESADTLLLNLSSLVTHIDLLDDSSFEDEFIANIGM